MNWDVILSVGVAAIGATWVLRGGLSRIEVALQGHVERDDQRHTDLSSRVVKLEDWRDGRRR